MSESFNKYLRSTLGCDDIGSVRQGETASALPQTMIHHMSIMSMACFAVHYWLRSTFHARGISRTRERCRSCRGVLITAEEG